MRPILQQVYPILKREDMSMFAMFVGRDTIILSVPRPCFLLLTTFMLIGEPAATERASLISSSVASSSRSVH